MLMKKTHLGRTLMSQLQSTKARLQHHKPDLTPGWPSAHKRTHSVRRHTIRHALMSCYACNKPIEMFSCLRPHCRRFCFSPVGWPTKQPCTCPVSLMWRSPEPSAHWLTVWASDLTHLGPPWLGLLCLCVQTSAPTYCTFPDWAVLACCRDGRAHVPVMNGGVWHSGKLAACYIEWKAIQVRRNHLCLPFSGDYATNNSGKQCRQNSFS